MQYYTKDPKRDPNFDNYPHTILINPALNRPITTMSKDRLDSEMAWLLGGLGFSRGLLDEPVGLQVHLNWGYK